MEALFHEFRCQQPRKKRKKRLSFNIESIGKERNARRATMDRVKPVIDAGRKLKYELSLEDEDISDLQILLGAAMTLKNEKEQTNTKTLNIMFHLQEATKALKSEERLNMKMTIEEICALRKVADLSVGQVRKLTKTLNIYKRNSKDTNPR